MISEQQNVAFVAGATGYTGRHVVRALRQRRIATFAHIRPDSPRREAWAAEFAVQGAEVLAVPWDAAKTGSEMESALRRIHPTLVFALLGTTHARTKAAARLGKAETYETVDYGLTARLIDVCCALPTPPLFIYLSSAGVSQHAKGAYLQARWRAEEKLRQSGLPYLIARPSFISGPDRDERRVGERVGAIIADGLFKGVRFVGASRFADRYRSIHPRELAEQLVAKSLDAHFYNTIIYSEDLRQNSNWQP